MTPEQEKRLQAIEAQWKAYSDPCTPEDALDEIAYFKDMHDDIKWLITRYRETDAHLQGKGSALSQASMDSPY